MIWRAKGSAIVTAPSHASSSTYGRGHHEDLDGALSSLLTMRVAALRRHWIDRFKDDPPPCQSAELLRRLLAWRLQEQRFGGLSPEVKRRLRRLGSGEKGHRGARPPSPTFKPGTVITREWRGSVWRVHVLESGFAYEGKSYRSLSEVTRKITGKRWSGPRFFGLDVDRNRRAADPSITARAR